MTTDMNLSVICGRLTTDPERGELDSGGRYVRYLVTVATDSPRRVDVVPVIRWHPSEDLWENPGLMGQRFWSVGSVQRRFYEEPDGQRRSKLQVIAEQVQLGIVIDDGSPS